MGALIARLVARLKALPASQRIVLGVGIPVVAVAAAVTVKRSPRETPTAGAKQRAATLSTGAQVLPGSGGAGASIPFGAGLDDMFRFQTKLADIENQIRKNNAPTLDPKRRPPGARTTLLMADDRNFVRIANTDPSAAAQAAAAARATAAAANARRAPVVATSTASPRTAPPPTLPSTRSTGRSRAPARSGAPTRLATRVREQERAPVKTPTPARKIAPRSRPPTPARKVAPVAARKIAPRSRPPTPARKVAPRSRVRRRRVARSRIRPI